MQNRGTLWGPPIKLGLLCIKNPIRGTNPPFFAVPPHVFVRLQMDAALRADLEPDMYTMVRKLVVKIK